MSREAPDAFAAATPVAEVDRDGVDRTLIRELLALSPLERVRRVEDAAQAVLLLRELNGAASAR